MTTGDHGGEPAPAGDDRTKVLTFESWVTRAAWHDYALAHPELIPFPLIDRSPCQDPFFDPFADAAPRRPVISGLCRGRAMRNFRVGNRFIYLTRIGAGIADRFGVEDVTGPRYLAVAALRVVNVWDSHQEASTHFEPRRYVAVPEQTPYAPNLAFANQPEAAAARVCSVIHDAHDRPHLPDDATDQMWRHQYLVYRARQRRSHLRVAECRVETQDGRECLRLHPDDASIVTPDLWGGVQMNVMGRWIPEEVAARLRRDIAGPDGPD